MPRCFIKRILPLALAAAVLLCPVTAMAEGDQPPPEAGTTESGALESGAEEAQDPAQPSLEEPGEPEPSEGDSLEPDYDEPDSQAPMDQEGQLRQATFLSTEDVLKLGGHDTYITGFAGGYFQPERAITRGETAQVFYNLLKEKPSASNNPFSDVPDSNPNREAIVALSNIGLIKGYTDGTFRPAGSITRAEFVTILGRCFSLEEGEPAFSDMPEENSWSYRYIVSATAKGWLNGYGDGTFRPKNLIKRCEAVKVVNTALGRRDDEGFAAGSETQKFIDVPKSHWAYKEIAEAGELSDDPMPSPTPTPEPTPTPTPAPTSEPGDVAPNGLEVGKQGRVNDTDGLWLRSSPNNTSDANKIVCMNYRDVVTVTDISKYPWIGVRTSSGKTGYCHGDYLDPYDGTVAPPPGPSQNGTLSASTVTLSQYQSLRLDAKVDSDISTMQWSTSNANVAVVGYTVKYNSREHGAIIYGKSPGTATLTFSDGAGNARGTCTVTVTAPQAVRSAYGQGNVIPVGTSFDLTAITDTTRDEVRFEIVSGPAKGSYTTNSYDTESRASSYGLPENRVRVFKRTVSFGAVGNYIVRAYSATGGSYANDYYQFAVQIVGADNGDVTHTSYDSRRASQTIIEVIANFEGYVPEVEDDVLAAKNPTVGYGYVVPVNSAFYNNMTLEEAKAFLINTVNRGSFATAVENYRSKYNLKMSQAQFDALVSFTYNLGPGNLNTADFAKFLIPNTVVPPNATESNPYRGVLNIFAGVLYNSPSVDSGRAGVVPKGAGVD
ncbi:MAG: SH3 domain-containing protein, partial [Acutalibacter sp.]|nr:SH3 domain-containing protein [Acutalibacter sp.]